ncbi:mandelate racemase/muconate lactonizing enzyme family protein [Nocardiopsis changdeensis]|uniref:Mandelate racemase/muconate lactonizing enzyme family protein n=1 Tax=Nocardiopsis changdeensis TaxID=2831969 RepID=A0ABX8BTN3_9ACTN|nr:MULTISPECIES: mandelate racemase/muconate lactonizing enzyme family protein [Nocardiopsis]QUX25622.1 mandelate racemase/muconate lactonizing enzyme family protein [Nocardiopsis changdeensis]QYX36009.1 mandelate racemase/muconate lactonizing enzyme family protein [Nocardiopsis sp. MT53]
MRVTAMRARAHRLPLHRAWDGGVDRNDIVVVEVDTDTGLTGTGFSWTPLIGARSVRALLEDDLRPALLGGPAHPSRWDELRRHLREAGTSGITLMALAAVDIALWDLTAKAAGLPLVEHLGRRRTTVPAYGSGVNLDYPLTDLQDQVRRWLAAGHRAVKIKVGSPDPARDAERVRAVRTLLGADGLLMVDANQRWDVPAAARALTALAEHRPHFIEEPLPADDLRSHVRLRSRTPVPFALGENLRTVEEFERYIDAGVCDIAQPNVVRVGGITPFLRIAEAADRRGVPVAPHLLPELSGQLALCLSRPAMVEDIDRASFADLGALAAPSGVRVERGALSADTGLGHGVVFADTLNPLP